MTVQEAIELHLKPLKERAFAHTTEKALDMAIECMKEVEQYRALGTVEELREAREKQIPKKPIIQETTEKKYYKCPHCNKIFVEAYDTVQRGYIPKYCDMCGQSIEFPYKKEGAENG